MTAGCEWPRSPEQYDLRTVDAAACRRLLACRCTSEMEFHHDDLRPLSAPHVHQSAAGQFSEPDRSVHCHRLFENLEEFISYAERQGSLLGVLIDYYGARVLSFFDRISGLLALIAAIFTVTWFQRSNELTAVTAAGIPSCASSGRW